MPGAAKGTSVARVWQAQEPRADGSTLAQIMRYRFNLSPDLRVSPVFYGALFLINEVADGRLRYGPPRGVFEQALDYRMTFDPGP